MRTTLLSLLAVLVLSASLGAGAAHADDPVAAAGGALTASMEETLRKGDSGSAVRRLQRRLGIPADGAFGPQTDRAVRRFQRRHGLVADGIVGPITRRELGLARFSSADVAHPRQGVSRRGNSGVKLPRMLRAIADCESGGDPRAVSSNGMYRGKFQFLRSTWKSLGGRGDPAKASEAQQDRIALKLFRDQGVSPWPACGARAKG